MLTTGLVYFMAASFGENVEAGSHEAKAAELGQEILEGTPHHDASQKIHVGSSGPIQASNNESAAVEGIQASNKATETNHGNITMIQQGQRKETTESGSGFAGNNVVVGNIENVKRDVELLLFLTAGIAYILVGFWMIKDPKNSRVPYMIATTISLILIGLYTASHTVGVPLVGVEHVGVLDLLVAALQIGIVGCSGYVIISRSDTIITKNAESSI